MGQLLVRNVPEEVRHWIEQGRQQHNMSQQEFVLSVLRRASVAEQTPLLPFESPVQEIAVPDSIPFTFVDLFAGIGGFRFALSALGGRCLFSCEWDRYSQKTYKAWFGETPHGDIRQIKPKDIPDHDVLAAGFPCQPFSIAGVSKRKVSVTLTDSSALTQGTLFFNIVSIVEVKRPPVLFLENVKNLRRHDGGRTWKTITESLKDSITSFARRSLMRLDGFLSIGNEFTLSASTGKCSGTTRSSVFPIPGPDAEVQRHSRRDSRSEVHADEPSVSKCPDYAKRHREKGNGFGFGIADPDGVSRTLSARYYKDGSEILIKQDRRTPRRLTPTECARSMGFPGDKKIVVSDTQAYRQFGNAVVPKAAKAVGRIIATLRWHLMRSGCLVQSTPRTVMQDNR